MAPKKVDYLILANQNINYRDKFLKIFQYSSRFLMGFYGGSLTPEGAEQLRMSVHNVLLVRRSARYCFFMIFFKNALAKMQKLANGHDGTLLDWSPNAGMITTIPPYQPTLTHTIMSHNTGLHEPRDGTYINQTFPETSSNIIITLSHGHSMM